ncbi:MAG: hypothetical protein Q8Q20_03885 [bacterium]|nr:hypothetical protein [bacterium]
MKFRDEGFQTTRIIAGVAIILAVSLWWWWAIGQEQAQTRDIQRTHDALIIQTAFEQLFQHDRSYLGAAEGGCEEIGVSVRRCRLRDYFRDINQLADPGKYDYIMSVVPTKTEYEVTFQLERGYGDLKAGQHTISPEGIQQGELVD